MRVMTVEDIGCVLAFLAEADAAADVAIARVRAMSDPKLDKWVERTETHWKSIKKGIKWLRAIAEQQQEARAKKGRKET